jgi:hypothetical protein
MNIDEIKTVWKEYDRKLQASRIINEKIIVSMITERTTTRFSKVRRNYIMGLLWMFICLLFGFAVIFGNPFDYKYFIQYMPMIIYCICLVILMSALFVSYLRLQNITITHHNLDISLKKIIAVYVRPNKFLKYTLIIFLISQIFLFPLSFLPPNIERMGLWKALADRIIPVSISALMLFIAYKLGAFKDRHGKKFREDQRELQELRTMSLELQEGESV